MSVSDLAAFSLTGKRILVTGANTGIGQGIAVSVARAGGMVVGVGRSAMDETAGFYNTVGFNDDTRAFPSIPARHDVARRVDCAFLARLVAEHRLREDEAHELAVDLAYTLAKKAYRL